jgi:hypothetical protein
MQHILQNLGGPERAILLEELVSMLVVIVCRFGHNQLRESLRYREAWCISKDVSTGFEGFDQIE